MKRLWPTSRLAENTDGEAVKALLMEAGPFDPSIPFGDIHPYWVVAEFPHMGIVGCLQTCPSRPIGRLEMMAVSKALKDSERAQVVRELFAAGMTCLHFHRCYMAAGFVPFELKSYKRWLKKRGSVVADSGNMIMWRLDMDVALKRPYKENGAREIAA